MVNGYRKTAKNFLKCSTGNVLFLYQTQSFPKPCCPNFFISLYQLGCRQAKEGAVWTFLNSLVFLVRDSLKKFVPWATGIAFSLLFHPPFTGNLAHRLILVGPLPPCLGLIAAQGLFPSISSEQVSRVVLAPPVHLWIDKPKYKWEMGDGFPSPPYAASNLLNFSLIWARWGSVPCAMLCPQAHGITGSHAPPASPVLLVLCSQMNRRETQYAHGNLWAQRVVLCQMIPYELFAWH